MLFEEFKDYVVEHILDNRLELKERAKIHVAKVKKNNGKELTSLTIMEEGTNMAPTLYLEYHYGDYINGRSIEECMDDMLYVYDKYKMPFDIHMEFIESFENASEKIVAKLINYEMNRDYLEDKPYFRYGDLAVIFQVKYESFRFGLGATTITNPILDDWEIKDEELLNCALANMEKNDEVKIVSMFVFTDENGNPLIAKEDLPKNIGPGMYVLSTKDGINGAVGMLRLDLIQNFADRAEKNVYIIPSSIHEVILVPDFGRISIEELKDMVESVNANQVAEEEILSNNVYFYNRKTHKISVAGTKNCIILRNGREELCS